MRPVGHIAAGVGLGGFIYKLTANWQLALICITAEIFWDIDHLIDHLMQSKYPLSVKTFFCPYSCLNWPKVILIFHSYEVVILMALIGWYYMDKIILFLALGGGAHMLLDETGNRHTSIPIRIVPWFYFFSYRLSQGFRTKALLTKRAMQTLTQE